MMHIFKVYGVDPLVEEAVNKDMCERNKLRKEVTNLGMRVYRLKERDD
jgi:hypothetical protein